jgi:hypothetical protein
MAKTKSDLSGWASDIDSEATRALIAQIAEEGEKKPWDKLESDPKKFIANYRRICPKRPEWPNPYQIFPVHYLGPNSRLVICLKEAGIGECPACVLRWQLHEAKAEAEARGLRASIRTFLNVVRLDKEGNIAEDKVFLLGLNQLQFLGKRGVEYDSDEESELPLFNFFEKYGDLSHVETGRDLLIKAKDDKQGDYNVQKLKFSVADPSPFPGTSELLEENLVDLPTVVTAMEPTEMVATIEGRATGAMQLAAPGTAPAAQLPAPTEAPAKASRFGGAEDEEEATEPEASREEPAAEQPAEAGEKEDARAAAQPPKTDPAAAIERLRKNQGNGS